MEELIASVKQTHSVPLKRTDPPEVVIAPTVFLLVKNIQPLVTDTFLWQTSSDNNLREHSHIWAPSNDILILVCGHIATFSNANIV